MKRLRVVVVRRGQREALVCNRRAVAFSEDERFAFAVTYFHFAGVAEEERRHLALVEAGTFRIDHPVVPRVPVPEAEADGTEKFAVVVVGTTSARTLESLYCLGVQCVEGKKPAQVAQWEPYNDTKEYDSRQALAALIQ